VLFAGSHCARVPCVRPLRMPASASAAIQHQLIARRDGKGFGKSITSPSPSWRSFANFSCRERRLGYRPRRRRHAAWLC
jgi:hypothetical protein